MPHVPRERCDGQVEQLASYEAACAACHDEKIATSVGRGVPMLALPTLDVEALKKAGHDIGAMAEGGDGRFRRPAAAGDEAAAGGRSGGGEAMAKLGADFEFQDVDPDDPQAACGVCRFGGGDQDAAGRLSKRGPAAVRERLSAALGRDVTDAEVATLMAGLSVDTVRGAVAAWLPGVPTTGNGRRGHADSS